MNVVGCAGLRGGSHQRVTGKRPLAAQTLNSATHISIQKKLSLQTWAVCPFLLAAHLDLPRWIASAPHWAHNNVYIPGWEQLSYCCDAIYISVFLSRLCAPGGKEFDYFKNICIAKWNKDLVNLINPRHNLINHYKVRKSPMPGNRTVTYPQRPSQVSQPHHSSSLLPQRSLPWAYIIVLSLKWACLHTTVWSCPYLKAPFPSF
jgi:hypothetical protein